MVNLKARISVGYVCCTLTPEKPYTGKSDPNPKAFIALNPETNFLPSRNDRLVAF